MKTKAPSALTRAFSLVELLVVISVIAIIAGFAVPAVTTMIKGSQLTQGSQMITDQLALARQTSLTRNRPVEVRFYKFGDPESPGETATQPDSGFFRALQVFEILENGASLPMGPIQRLPVNVIMNEGKFSTILNRPKEIVIKPKDSDPEMPDAVVKKNYYYVPVRFLSDGSTNLPASGTEEGPETVKGDTWYITLHGTNVKKGSSETDGKTTTLPDNYFTLQLDPITGVARAFRPNLGS